MASSSETFQRPWEVIGDICHYDQRINLYGLRDLVIEEIKRIRAERGVFRKIEVIPYRWELDQNFSSVLIRGEGPEGSMGLVFNTEPVEQPDGTKRLQFVEELESTKVQFET